MKSEITEKVLLAVTGVLVGVANGFFGGGGGMLVVPMLVLLLKKEARKAHATAILIILPITVVSGLMYAVYGRFKLNVGLPATLGVVVGGIIGALILKKINGKLLTEIFAFVILAAGVKMLFF